MTYCSRFLHWLKKAAKKLSDYEEEEDDHEQECPDLEGEKENEDLRNEGASPVSKPKKQRKRKSKKDAGKEEPKGKKKKSDKQISEEGTEVRSYFIKMFFALARFSKYKYTDPWELQISFFLAKLFWRDF